MNVDWKWLPFWTWKSIPSDWVNLIPISADIHLKDRQKKNDLQKFQLWKMKFGLWKHTVVQKKGALNVNLFQNFADSRANLSLFIKFWQYLPILPTFKNYSHKIRKLYFNDFGQFLLTVEKIYHVQQNLIFLANFSQYCSLSYVWLCLSYC